MTSKSLTTVPSDDTPVEDLKEELVRAQNRLLEAEAELAEEQAAVNAFRMHCRLKLDEWINRLLELQTERQSLLTRLELMKQAQGFGFPFDEEDPFWLGNQDLEGEDSEEELILPTDVPRDKEAEKQLYRQLARRFHPDLGATAVEIAYRTEMMASVNTAYEAGDVQTLYDLAGQLDPEDLTRLATITNNENRELSRRILRYRQRRRRAQRRLATLREENTARLWQKALLLKRDDIHWWEVVRLEIERATERVQAEVTELQDHIDSLMLGKSKKINTN